MTTRSAVSAVFFLCSAPTAASPQLLGPGFQRTAPFDEQVRWSRLGSGVRTMVNAPATLRADRRLLVIFATPNGNLQHTSGLGGQIQFFIHPNPGNKILHTALVGEMNGLLHGLTLGTDRARQWGQFGGPRAYGRWIQPRPFVDPTGVRAVIPADAPQVRWALPDRPADAPTGTQFREQILNLGRGEREAAILREITRGNVPDFLRTLTPIRVEATDPAGAKLVATYFVTCDYLAVGRDDDFFRVPMAPRTAAAIADATRCSLITAKISDDIFAAAPLKLAPKPLTKDRDAAATFFAHHEIIEEQLRDKPRGRLVAGIKKDVVLTRRLAEKPHRTAIYGWHYPDGRPIQLLYVGHVDWYVDYSHGIRLLADQVLVENRSLTTSRVLRDPRLHVLLSSEGPLDPVALRKAAAW